MKNWLVLILLIAAGHLSAQEKSVNPGINKSFQNPNVEDFVGRFEREGRDAYDHREEILKACKIRPGMAVADIGAGTGLFTRLFAKAVGPKGQIYAVDISEKFVKHIEQQAEADGIKNIQGVVCGQDSVKLPPQSIDLAYICDVYHHFEFPEKTMRSIHRALKPGGQVVLVDYQRIPGKTSERMMKHLRAGQEVFTKEIIAAGFRQIEEKKDLLDESYFVRFEKVEDAKVSGAGRDPDGFLVHKIDSPYQSGPTEIRVLLPHEIAEGKFYSVVYVLPVEAGRGDRYGDGLLEVQKHDLANKLGVIFAAPTFADLPWYADHPTNVAIRQETYFVNFVVPFVEKTYPADPNPKGRLLLGFSKSGWGAWSLLLRHPETFSRAAAWDAPLMMDQLGKYGTEPIFGTQDHFETYRIADLLKAAKLDQKKRLILTGYGNFLTHHQQTHALLEELHIPHEYRDGPQRKHDWHSGWLAEAAELLTGKV